MNNQIINEKTGIITTYEVKDIAEAIESMLEGKNNDEYINNLRIEKENFSIERQMTDFYKKISS